MHSLRLSPLQHRKSIHYIITWRPRQPVPSLQDPDRRRSKL